MKEAKEWTSELETWRQQEANYIKLQHDHAESTRKAAEDIPEAKNRLGKVQLKIDTAAKDINDVGVNDVFSWIASLMTGLSRRPSKRKSSSSNGLEISMH